MFTCAALHAVHIPTDTNHPQPSLLESPWFTGPLLAPSPLTIAPGHINYEPYIYAIANVGKYDHHWHPEKNETFWSIFTQQWVEIGINSWMDFEFVSTLFYNHTSGASKWEVGDLPVQLDFQLYKNLKRLDLWSHALSFTIKETIPIGKYRNLHANKKGTDVGGGGSWQTTFILNQGNLFHIGGNHFLSWRNSFQYTLPAPVHVTGLNVYGGGPGTDGTVYPAQIFAYDTAIELSLTQNWVFAMDVLGVWTGKSRFKGKTLFPNTAPPSVQFSLAPAIEYNWSDDIGLIVGSWFTIAGRNADQFVGAVAAFNYYH